MSHLPMLSILSARGDVHTFLNTSHIDNPYQHLPVLVGRLASLRYGHMLSEGEEALLCAVVDGEEKWLDTGAKWVAATILAEMFEAGGPECHAQSAWEIVADLRTELDDFGDVLSQVLMDVTKVAFNLYRD